MKKMRVIQMRALLAYSISCDDFREHGWVRFQQRLRLNDFKKAGLVREHGSNGLGHFRVPGHELIVQLVQNSILIKLEANAPTLIWRKKGNE